jgi:hypothetical protein
MGRQPRPIADGLVYHALNRGNNRHAVFTEFTDAADFQAERKGVMSGRFCD